MKSKFLHPFFWAVTFIVFFNGQVNAQDVTINSSQTYTGLATSPLLPGATNQAILGIRLDKTAGSNTLNTLVIQCDQDPSLRFSSVALRNSNDADFSNLEPVTATGTIGTSTITFSPSFSLGGGATNTYFFVVVTVRADVLGSYAPITLSFSGSDITLSDNNPIASGSTSGSAYSFLGATIGSLNTPANNVAASPLIPGATGQAVFGFSLSSNGSQTVSGINVQTSSTSTGKLTGLTLIQSTDADFATTGDNTVVSLSGITPSATEVQITPTTPINISTTKNLFIVTNADAGTAASTPPIQMSLSAANITVNQGAKEGSATSSNYSFLGATIGSLNAGTNNVAASPLPGGATGQSVFGFSLVSNGSQTVSAINVQLTNTPSGKLSGFSLVQSADADFATTGDNSVVATSSITATATEVQITPATAIDISSVKNLFLVADIDPSVTGATTAIQASLAASNITVNQGAKEGSASGTNYSFVAPTATIGSLNAGTNNIAPSPLPGGATGKAIFGFSLASNGSQTVSAMNVQFTSDPAGILSGYSLVQSTDTDFATTGDNSVVPTSGITATASEVQITLTSAIDISSVKNLFLVANVDPSVTGASGPIQPSLAGANFTVNQGTKAGSATGTNYSFTSPTATITSLNAGTNNIATSPIFGGSTGQAVFGFSLASDGSQTVSAINVQVSADPAGIFSGYSLVQSTDADFATTGDNSVVPTSSITATTSEVQITPVSSIDISSGKNLFLVANVSPTVTGSSGPIQPSLASGNFTVNQGGKAGSATGTSYSFTPLTATITSLNAGPNNIATSPMIGGSAGQAVFGFSLASNGNQTVSAINVQLSADPAGIFSGYSLVQSTDADFATTGDNSVVPTSSITATTSEVQIAPTAAINISSAKNLFLVANVDPSVTGASGPIQPSLAAANVTVNQGNKAGSAMGTSYSFTPLTATITSLNAGANNVAASPLLGGATGQAVFGFSLTSNGNQTVSAINVQLSADPAGIFSGYSLVQSTDADFATTGDNSVVPTSSITATTSEVQITPTAAINISSTKNLFLVANVDPSVTGASGPIQPSLAAANVTVNQGNKAGSATGTSYSFTPLTATITSLNAGANNVAASPLLGGATGQAVFGFSLTSNGSQTVSAINVQLSSDPAAKFSTFSLVLSTDADFATTGDNSVVATSSITVTATEVQVVPSAPINISSVKNLFLVANVDASVTGATAAIQASLGTANFTVNQGNKAGSATGIDYSFNPLTASITSLNAGANNVAASPLTGGATGQAVFGFSLASNGSQTVSAINVQLSGDPAARLGTFSLILSTDADFATSGDNSVVATSSITVTATEVQIVPSAPINITSVKNLFLIANVDPSVTGAAAAIQASLGTANFTVNQGNKAGAVVTGINYNFQELIATVTSLNGVVNNVATSPLLGGSVGQAIFGFALSSNGNQTVSSINIPLSSDPAGKLSGFSLLQSGDANFATGGDNTTVPTSGIVATTTEVQITLVTPVDISIAKNFFLTANVDPTVTNATSSIQIGLSNTFVVNQGNKTGVALSNNYSFQTLTATIGSLNSVTNNVAASPLIAGSAGQAVFGFSIASNGSQSVTVINIQLTSDPAGSLGSFSLVQSTDADFATSGDNSPIATSGIVVAASNIQITPTTAIDISTIKNLFLVATVNAGVTSSSSPIQHSLTDVNFAVNQGYKAGSATGINYSFNSSQTTAITVDYQGQMSITLSEYNDTEANPANVTSSNSQEIFGITVTDGDADTHSTTITQLVFNLTNTDNLATISLFDGTTKIASQAVTGSTATFNGLSYVVADGTTGSPNSETLSVYVTFAANVDDQETISVTLTSASASPTGSGIASFSGIQTLAGRNVINVDDTEIRFFNAPGTVSPNLDFTLIVQATDVYGNVDIDRGGAVTLSKDSGLGTLTAGDAGGLIRSFTSGEVTWTQLQFDLADDYVIRAEHSSFADITHNISVISLGVLITGPVNQNFCFGGNFTPLNNIVIAERDPSDFGTGNDVSLSFILPSGFIFDTSLTSVTPTVTGGSNVSGISAITYPASNIARFTYDVSAANSLDGISISGLQVRYTGTAPVANQDIFRIGGSALQAGNNVDTDPPLSHGTLSASAASNTSYNFEVDEFSGQPAVNPTETRFSVFTNGIKLLPSASNPVSGGTFSGNGVSYSTTQNSFIFSPSSVGVGSYSVTHTINDGACVITRSKTFDVFATTITNLNPQYCSNSDPSLTLSVTQSSVDNATFWFGDTPGDWVFYDFVYYDPLIGNFLPIPAPNNIFDVQASQYQSSILSFRGVYIYYRARNIDNTTLDGDPVSPNNGTIIIAEGQFVIVNQAPDVTLTIPSAFCFNGPSIDLDNAVNLPPANPSDLFTSSHSGTTGITNAGNQWTFNPGGVENADLSSQPFNLTYEYTNPATGCSNSVTKSVTVYPTPGPVPSGNIISGTTLLVCKDGLSGDFVATPISGSYNWYNSTFTPPALRTDNVFNPNGYFDASTPGSTNFFVTRTVDGCESTGPHLQLTLTVHDLPTVDAGPVNTSTCAGEEVNLISLGATFGGTASSATWTANGSSPGQFLDASDVVVPMPAAFGTAVKYIPSASDITNGNVILRLTTNDPVGPCTAVFDDVQIIINSVAQANAGTNQIICAGPNIQLNGTIGGAATSQTWYKNSIAPGNILGTTLSLQYTPTLTEIQNGAVIDFILVTDDPPGLCPAASSSVNVIINQRPTVDAGITQVVCSGDPILLDGTFGATANSVTWSGGTGSFTDNTLADTEYLPSASELLNGAVISLTLLTDDPTGPCAAESDVMQVTINPIPNAPLANSPAPYCVDDPIANLTATGNNLKWYDDAPLTNQVSAGSTFASGVQADVEKTVSFYVTQTILGCESPSTGVTITVNPLPVPDFSAVNFCFGDAMAFTDASTVDNGTIVKWGWRFDDGDDLQRSAGVINSNDSHNGRTSGTYNSPLHTYASTGTYSVRLVVESDKGCLNLLNKTFQVGAVPQANFVSRNVCEDDVTQFYSLNTNPQPAVITTYEWDFGDPNSGTANTSTVDNPTHQFAGSSASASGVYAVTLRLVTNLGCESTIAKDVSILPYITSFPYVEGFEQSGHGWVSDGLNFNQLSSWQLNSPNGQIINTAANGSSMAWFTRVDSIGTYYNNERSVLYGPCLDMTQIDRPVLSMQYWNNTDLGNDGAYLETSTDGGQTWQILGAVNQGGLNWYNRAAILGLAQQNGVGQPIGQVGWTGDTWDTNETTGWTYAKFNMDGLRNQTKLRIRLVFGSNGDNPTDRIVDGFAFDDFRIEQRNRTILAENFTNTSVAQAGANNSSFRTFQNTVTSNELVKIQYHTSIGGTDPIHIQNTIDPNARAAFYGVTSSLKGYIDGSSNGDFLAPAWADNEYNTRALVASPIEISIATSSDGTGIFTVQPTITTITDLPINRQYVIHTAIVEKQVGTEAFVLRKLLPTAAGIQLTALSQGDQQTETLSTMLTNIEDPLQVAVIVFVQELLSPKEVIQASLLDNIPPPLIVTGAENVVEGADIHVFPSPANKEFHIRLHEAASKRMPFQLYDTFGHIVHESVFEKGEQIKTIDTTDFASGMYMLKIKGRDASVVSEKIMVVHR